MAPPRETLLPTLQQIGDKKKSAMDSLPLAVDVSEATVVWDNHDRLVTVGAAPGRRWAAWPCSLDIVCSWLG